ncbi:DNA internalization-related competence protein ComEC/Rec2 [Lactobacillus sp. ESL0684]|uniref:DNA internalization-related competence protein ComEC/Rec2 n=1 Tax=Lactobacillus sp. ESL0684 TaxID=2983213 RepID=UPI0023F73F54|nr:DNA internalization-related competence protein ComEC/Rec2 [Lactobacillus sp. ESL0684]WEV44510.1 DNA internalization-related competence protein ComEC/Rec2 [Lactobacillus sp. ESL0684]
MPHSKISWKSEILSPGFLVLTALLLIDLSFLVYQCATKLSVLICLLFAFGLVILILHNYRGLGWVLILLLITSSLFVKLHQNKTDFIINDQASIKLYPDQVKVEDNWLSGTGKVAGGQVLVSTSITNKQTEQLKQGHQIVLTNLVGDVSPIMPATNYGQFNLKSYYAGKNIWQQVKLKSCELTINSGGILDYVHYLRYTLQRYFSKMPKILDFFSNELILGENPSQANQQILDNYRNLGVIHILSISGLHVGIYVLVISSICFYFKLTEKETFICCTMILLIGIFLSNGQAGFVRACLNYLLGQLFKFKKLQIRQYDLLGLTCILHLLIQPRLMMGVGAVLSYTLTFGLVATDKMTNIKQSMFLNLLLTPLLLLYFFQFNLLTVIFNLLIVPYFNWIVMPITFINLVVFAILPDISKLFSLILDYGEIIIGKISATKVGLLTFGKINWWQCLVLLVLSLALLLYLNDKTKKHKIIRRLSVSLGIFYITLFAMIHFPLTGQVSLIDVGQGDSILITTPFPRRVYLIDVGGKLNFSGKKLTPQVNKITIPLLKAQGIGRINGIFVTHQDSDHVGDLGPILEQVQVDKLYMAQGLLNNPSFQKRINGRINENQIIQLLAGKQVIEPQINFQVVYPFEPGPGKNEDSLSLTFNLAGKRWLFTGDLGQAGEAELMTKYQLHADYFKLGHHGSRTASNPDFLQKLHPEKVFISAGRNNRFGHPHPETLATLKKQQIPWASTQDCGMITWTYGKFVKPKFKSFLSVNHQ